MKNKGKYIFESFFIIGVVKLGIILWVGDRV